VNTTLAQSAAHAVHLYAGLAAIEPASRDEALRRNSSRLTDAENRLALALEGFGEVIRNGDHVRAEKIVAELEVPRGDRRRRRREYRDLIRCRDNDRAMLRRLDRLRRRMAEMKASRAPSSELRPLRSEIKILEEICE
jgi:hypothetical protein